MNEVEQQAASMTDGLSRRRFVGRSAGAFAALSGGGLLLAACGSDDSASGSSAGSSTTASAKENATIVNILPPSWATWRSSSPTWTALTRRRA